MTDQQPYEPPQPHQPSPAYQPPQGTPAAPAEAPATPSYPAPPAAQPAYPVQPPAQQAPAYPGAPAAPAQPAYPAAAPGYPAQPGYATAPGYPAQPGYPAAPGYQGYPAPAYGAPGAQPLGASSPDDLSLPLYGATFGQAITRFFKKYASFTGRASRSEYWWVQLFLGLVSLVAVVLLAVMGGFGAAQASATDSNTALIGVSAVVGIAWLIFGLAVIVPGLAITWRRLHDANFAGPFWFLSFTYIGGLVVLVFTILPSNAMGQRFDRR